MRTQANCVDFLRALVVYVRVEQFFGEDITLEQELMIFVESIESVFKRAWHGWNLRQLLWTKIVNVLVEGLA